jgi:hypothetical protein
VGRLGQYIDAFSNLKFSPAFDFDDELHACTVSLTEINLYGTGATREDAVADLLDSISEYLQVYAAKTTIFSKLEPDGKLLYVLKLAQRNGDREATLEEIGLSAAGTPVVRSAEAAPARFDQGQIRRLLAYFQMAPIKRGGSIYVGGTGRDGAWRTCKFDYHEDDGRVTASAAGIIARSLRFKDATEMKQFLGEKVIEGDMRQ